jgi:competence protein ComEA
MDRLLPWLRRSGWAYVAAAIALAVVAWRLGPAAGGGGGQPAPPAASTAGSLVTAPDAPRALIHVAGEVRRPGVYPIAPGARVIQAIRRAGGPTPRADLAALNLAAVLQDGQQVLIPAGAPNGAPAATGAGKRTGPLSLSSATAEDLEALDGIGPTLAQRIVEWRTAHGGLASVDQLLDVPGIGPARLDALRADVVP